MRTKKNNNIHYQVDKYFGCRQKWPLIGQLFDEGNRVKSLVSKNYR